MIKKLLSITALAAVFSTASAQSNFVAESAGSLNKQALLHEVYQNNNSSAEKSSTILVGDTLWYNFNKHYYRNAAGTGFFTVKTPYSSTVAVLDRFGCKFQNNGSLTINGLEAIVSRQASSPTASISVRVLLYNVSAGLPVLPALDSITAVVSGTAAAIVGGNFAAPKVVTGDYAVMYRPVGLVTGDTIRAWMNNAYTATATTGTSAQKYGEGMGLVRVTGTVVPMTGTFGAGSDYEFLVMPRVGFSATASQTSSTVTPYCTSTPYTFNNTSSYWLGHRQYNLNQFYRSWKPFTNTVTIAADSVFTWNFGDGTGNQYTTAGNPNINHAYATAGTFNGTLTAKYQRMVDNNAKFQDAANFSKTVSTCAGIQNLSGVDAIVLYPNPSTNGLVNIANLPSESTIEVVNMLGQSVFKDKANAGNYSADLSTLPNGSYFVKINAANEKTKIVKLILN